MSENKSREKGRSNLHILIPAVALAGALLFALPGMVTARRKMTDIERICRTSIFSWEDRYLFPEEEERVSFVMARLDCGAIYQQVPVDIEEEVLLEYLENRHEKGQDVYYLAGAAEWGIETYGTSMLAHVETVAAINKRAGGKGFVGIVWDVEPYLLEKWEESPGEVMKQYVKNSEEAYTAAKKHGLSVIACIPYFYDNKGLESELEQLVAGGCDAIAVMNYNKRDEKGQIALEYQLARKYKKGVIHITELQKPGYHDLTEHNTYYYEGLDGVSESWEALREAFPEGGLGFSWHYLDPVLTILEGDDES